MATLRKTEPDEWHLVRDVAFAAFEDLERRQGEPPTPIPPDEVVKKRFSHLIETDRGGALNARQRPVVSNASAGRCDRTLRAAGRPGGACSSH